MANPKPTRQYAKTFIPLESDPALFTSLVRTLGVTDPGLSFADIYSLDPAELPANLHALILAFPTTDAFEASKAAGEAANPAPGDPDPEPVLWFSQTIHNACGLYAILHSLANGPARARVPADSVLGQIFARSEEAGRTEARARVLETSEELEAAHRTAAMQGQSEVPEDPEAEVTYHYIAFVRHGGRLYELDGDRKGPVVRGPAGKDGGADGNGTLRPEDVDVVRKFVDEISRDGGIDFSLIGLVVE